MRNVLWSLVLTLAATEAAAQKIAVVPFVGPGAASARNVLISSLCADEVECVPANKVAAGAKPDWKKAKAQKVSFFVTGKVVKKKGKGTLELQVLNKPGKPKLKSTFPLDANGELSEKTLNQAVADISRAMGVKPKPVEEKAPEPVAEATPAPVEEKAPPPVEEKPAPVAKKTAPPPPPPEPERQSSDREDQEEEPATKVKAKNPFIAVEAGAFLGNRSFSYTQAETSNVRSYNAPFMVAPAFRLEFYPIALLNQGWASGLGIEGGYRFAVGLKSRRAQDDLTYPTSASQLDVGLRFRIRPVASSSAAVIPFVGYRLQTFNVGAASDGSTIDGLPGIAYSALRPGLAGELPFGDSPFMVFAKFAVLVVFSSGQIISPDYFTGGSTFGLEGALGLDVRIIGPLHVRAAFDFLRYGLSFKTSPTDKYIAAGAADLYIGGTAALRLVF